MLRQREHRRVCGDYIAPFGKVVRPLEPYRQTFAVKLLWSPLPTGWERGSITAPLGTGRALTISRGALRAPSSFVQSRPQAVRGGGRGL
jgi:hypothetical protein